MNEFTERVLFIIKAIPEGMVMTYGQIAALAGNRRGARQVGRVLHSMSAKHDLPWYRVVNAQGKISIGDDLAKWSQRNLLEKEGVIVSGEGLISLSQYLFQPEGLEYFQGIEREEWNEKGLCQSNNRQRPCP